MASCSRFLAILIIGCVIANAKLDAQPDPASGVLIQNGQFEKWQDGLPVGWTAEKGAGADQGKESLIQPLDKGGIRMSGDSMTQVWRSLNQELTAKPGSTLTLKYEARSNGLRREGNQFDNCFVALFFADQQGTRLGMPYGNVTSTRWTKDQFSAKVPEGTVKTSVLVFLSKTGKLEVRSVAVSDKNEADSFDMLLDDMRRYYSFADLKEVDWDQLKAEYRDKAMAAKSPKAFIRAVQPMLAGLKDVHVWIVDPAGNKSPTFFATYAANSHFPSIKKKLTDIKKVDNSVLLARTEDQIGYVAIGSLVGPPKAFHAAARQIESLFDSRAMIIDLRMNKGGSEDNAAIIAGLFTAEPTQYAQSVRRNGPDPTDFGKPAWRSFAPSSESPFSMPVVCLIGPGCISSGEGMAMMMKALPHVTLIGLPTRGASGNPMPVSLPNGVKVFYSRWVSMLPDGQTIEGTGIAPDQNIPHKPGLKNDPAFEAAIQYLQEELDK